MLQILDNFINRAEMKFKKKDNLPSSTLGFVIISTLWVTSHGGGGITSRDEYSYTQPSGIIVKLIHALRYRAMSQ